MKKQFAFLLSSMIFLVTPTIGGAELLGANPLPGISYATQSLPSVLPDICTGIAGCITFTNSGTLTLANLLNASNQIGKMTAQQFQQAPLGSIISQATQAGIAAQIQQLSASTSATEIANAIAQAIFSQHGQATNDLASLGSLMQHSGTSPLAATQIESAILQQLVAKVEQQNALQAAQRVQEQAEIKQGYATMGKAFGLDEPVTAGWLL